jgi:septum formation protein
MEKKLILASASPRRKEILEMVGLDFEVIPGAVDESFLEGETPRDHVLRLSREKAEVVSMAHPDAWVLGADTVVLINGEVLGKPVTRDEAKMMLMKLSGRAHCVMTGFTILRKSSSAGLSHVAESTVVFKAMSAEEMEWYAGTEEPYDKAGGYAVQGMGACLIREVQGSYTNVVGLPLCEVIDALRQLGAARIC